MTTTTNAEDSQMIEDQNEEAPAEKERIGFLEALMAPYVIMYGLTYLCVKFSVTSTMLWLPLYLAQEKEYTD